MKYYRFHQNNSGGSFSGDYYTIYIQAKNADDANEKATDYDIYFDSEYDCPCCGPRWSECWDHDGDMLEDIDKENETSYAKGWGLKILVVHADGRNEIWE